MSDSTKPVVGDPKDSLYRRYWKQAPTDVPAEDNK